MYPMYQKIIKPTFFLLLILVLLLPVFPRAYDWLVTPSSRVESEECKYSEWEIYSILSVQKEYFDYNYEIKILDRVEKESGVFCHGRVSNIKYEQDELKKESLIRIYVSRNYYYSLLRTFSFIFLWIMANKYIIKKYFIKKNFFEAKPLTYDFLVPAFIGFSLIYFNKIGLPFVTSWDEFMIVKGLDMVNIGNLNPHQFDYGNFLPYLVFFIIGLPVMFYKILFLRVDPFNSEIIKIIEEPYGDFLESSWMVFGARIIPNIFLVLQIYIIWRILDNLENKNVKLFTLLIIATLPLTLTLSREYIPEIISTSIFYLSLYLNLKNRDNDLKVFNLSILIYAIAVGIKANLLILGWVYVYFLAKRKKVNITSLLSTAAIFLYGFLVFNPAVLIEPRVWYGSLYQNLYNYTSKGYSQVASLSRGIESFSFHSSQIVVNLTILLTIFSFLGLILLVNKQEGYLIILLIPTVSLLLFTFVSITPFHRNLYHIYPCLLIGIAYLANFTLEKYNKNMVWVGLLICSLPYLVNIQDNHSLYYKIANRVDSRILAIDFLEKEGVESLFFTKELIINEELLENNIIPQTTNADLNDFQKLCTETGDQKIGVIISSNLYSFFENREIENYQYLFPNNVVETFKIFGNNSTFIDIYNDNPTVYAGYIDC